MELDQYVRLTKIIPSLGVSRRVAYYWARHGVLPGAIQIEGAWLIRVSDLKAFLANKHREAEASCLDCTNDEKAPSGTQRSSSREGRSGSQLTSQKEFEIEERLNKQLLRLKQLSTAS